jgi:hypothetical protein
MTSAPLGAWFGAYGRRGSGTHARTWPHGSAARAGRLRHGRRVRAAPLERVSLSHLSPRCLRVPRRRLVVRTNEPARRGPGVAGGGPPGGGGRRRRRRRRRGRGGGRGGRAGLAQRVGGGGHPAAPPPHRRRRRRINRRCASGPAAARAPSGRARCSAEGRGWRCSAPAGRAGVIAGRGRLWGSREESRRAGPAGRLARSGRVRLDLLSVEPVVSLQPVVAITQAEKQAEHWLF